MLNSEATKDYNEFLDIMITQFNDFELTDVFDFDYYSELLLEDSRLISGAFDDNHWILHHEATGTNRHFYFDLTINGINLTGKELKIIKCWIVSLLQTSGVPNVQAHLTNLIFLFNATDILDERKKTIIG